MNHLAPPERNPNTHEPNLDRYNPRLIKLPPTTKKLSVEEEKNLIAQAKNGDEGAMLKIMAAYQRWIYGGKATPAYAEDMQQERAMAIIEAVRNCDPNKSDRLAAYLGFFRQKTAHAIQAQTNTLPLRGGDAARSIAANFWRAEQKIRAQHDNDISKGELLDLIAEELRVKRKLLEEVMMHWMTPMLELDKPVSTDGDGDVYLEISDSQRTPEAELEWENAMAYIRNEIARAVKELDERMQYIMKHRTLAAEGKAHTLDALGDHFGITKERVRQLEEAAKKSLAQKLGRNRRYLLFLLAS